MTPKKYRRLSRPVIIYGKNIYGQEAKIMFRPCVEKGIFWKANDCIVPVSFELAKKVTRQIELRHLTKAESVLYIGLECSDTFINNPKTKKWRRYAREKMRVSFLRERIRGEFYQKRAW